MILLDYLIDRYSKDDPTLLEYRCPIYTGDLDLNKEITSENFEEIDSIFNEIDRIEDEETYEMIKDRI